MKAATIASPLYVRESFILGTVDQVVLSVIEQVTLFEDDPATEESPGRYAKVIREIARRLEYQAEYLETREGK